MARQYTFKTTRDTEWIEEHLNSLPNRERSTFIRNCIISVLSKSHNVTQKDTQKVTHYVPPTPKESYKSVDNLFGQGEKVSVEEVDLDEALDNLSF